MRLPSISLSEGRLSITWPRKLSPEVPNQRSYREVLGIGNINSDWPLSNLSEDSEIWQNGWLLISRMRDLFRINPHFIKWREHLWSQIFGPNGIMTRYKIKETEDRIVNSPDEKWLLIQHERKINELREHAERMGRSPMVQYRCYTLADRLERSKPEDILSRQAMVKVGAPDLYAIQRCEQNKKAWAEAKYSDLRGRFNYNTHRLIRMVSAVRDGDIFIRMISDPTKNRDGSFKLNQFGFSLQLINAEWCDRFYNTTLPNGNVVIMGIEYEMTAWGIGAPVAYYFITRQPRDWQFSIPASFNFSAGNLHQRIDARDMIHYARPVDADGTRPAPWASSVITTSRQLSQAMFAELVAWRESACKTGFYYSDVLPEGGYGQALAQPDPSKCPTEMAAPGSVTPLEWGIKFQERNPTHPNANVETFRKASLRDESAGMPGSSYSALASDYESINFSAGRLDKLGTNDACEMLQMFDIDVAEKIITERLLEMSLLTGAIPLPVARFDKYNKAVFSGRRWPQVDEVKSEQASAMRITNNKSSWGIECSLDGKDFDEVVQDKAENMMTLEQFGLSPSTTADNNTVQAADMFSEDDATDQGTNPPEKKPSETKPKNGKEFPDKGKNGSNGHSDNVTIPITFASDKFRRKVTKLIRDPHSHRITGAEIEESN